MEKLITCVIIKIEPKSFKDLNEIDFARKILLVQNNGRWKSLHRLSSIHPAKNTLTGRLAF
ncbi:hypothetical protein ACX8XP_11580 [Calditrichota bacterium LG25]